MAIDPDDVILIGSLPPIGIPLTDYLVPVFRNGQTSYMSVAQIISLVAISSYSANDISFAPGGGIAATDVQAAILEAVSDLTALITPKFTAAPGDLGTAQAGVEAVQKTWTAAMLRAAARAAGGGAPDFALEDQKAQNTGGGSGPANTWNVRTLNTKTVDRFGACTLSGSTFVTTSPGWVEWKAPAKGAEQHQTRLWNVTDGVLVANGTSEYANGGGEEHTTSSMGGGPIVAGKTYRLEHKMQGGNFGVAANCGGVEVYSRVIGWLTA